jgi:hypothetical protein
MCHLKVHTSWRLRQTPLQCRLSVLYRRRQLAWFKVSTDVSRRHIGPRSRIQQSRVQSSWIIWRLKLGPICYAETSLLNYEYTLRKIPGKQRKFPRKAWYSSYTVERIVYRPRPTELSRKFPKYEQIIASLKIHFGICSWKFGVASVGKMRRRTEIHWKNANDEPEGL